MGVVIVTSPQNCYKKLNVKLSEERSHGDDNVDDDDDDDNDVFLSFQESTFLATFSDIKR